MKQSILDAMPTADGAGQAVFEYAGAYCTAQLPPELAARRAALQERQARQSAQGRLPAPLRVLQWLCGFLAVCSLCILLAQNAAQKPLPVVPTAALAVCAAAALALALFGRSRAARQKSSAAAQQLNEEAQALQAACRAALGVPEAALQADVLCRGWQPGDEQRSSVVPLGDFVNLPVRLWRQAESLCLLYDGRVYRFPLAQLGRPCAVRQKLLLPNWNKPDAPQSAVWRGCRLSVGGGGVYAPGYWELTVDEAGRVLRLPLYEERTLQGLSLLAAAVPAPEDAGQ